MKLGGWLRLVFCFVFFSLCLFFYVHKQNELKKVKFRVSMLQKNLQVLEDDNRDLEYQNEKLENPARLMELVSLPQYNHLKHPLTRDILLIQEGLALKQSFGEQKTNLSPTISMHLGAK